MKARKAKGKNRSSREIHDYDAVDTTDMIDPNKALKLKDLGLQLPELPPTQVVSIRLPTELLNELKALGSEQDVPYQALIKLFLRQAVDKSKRKQSA
jgi:predicted DNA binding CopG/RHH family protein